MYWFAFRMITNVPLIYLDLNWVHWAMWWWMALIVWFDCHDGECERSVEHWRTVLVVSVFGCYAFRTVLLCDRAVSTAEGSYAFQYRRLVCDLRSSSSWLRFCDRLFGPVGHASFASWSMSREIDHGLLGCCDLRLTLFVIIDSSDSSRTIESPLGDVMWKWCTV